MNWIKSLFVCETALLWAIIGISCAVCFLVDWKIGDSQGDDADLGNESPGRDVHAINLGPVLVWGTLIAIALATSSDPAAYYGLVIGRLGKIPWSAVAAIVAVAFLAGRVLDHILLPETISHLVRENIIIPGGSFHLLGKLDPWHALFLGTFYIGCQTFFEELIFRGICFDIFYRLIVAAGEFGLGEGLFDAIVIASLGQALLFGLLHYIPVRLVLWKRGEKVPLLEAYVLIMPTTLGFLFGMLNYPLDSLWPGWIAHFCLNYLTMAWLIVGQTAGFGAAERRLEKGGRRILPVIK